MRSSTVKSIPDGWLLDPKGRWLLLFHRYISALNIPPTLFYVDKWEASVDGIPTIFVNRRIIQLSPALETWNELIENGWTSLGFYQDYIA